MSIEHERAMNKVREKKLMALSAYIDQLSWLNVKQADVKVLQRILANGEWKTTKKGEDDLELN